MCRTWRLTGLAYEQRECRYLQPNRSLLSTAHGRSKEYKDRSCSYTDRTTSVHLVCLGLPGTGKRELNLGRQMKGSHSACLWPCAGKAMTRGAAWLPGATGETSSIRPIIALGTACEDASLYRISNQHFVHNAVDIAEHNVEVSVARHDTVTECGLLHVEASDTLQASFEVRPGLVHTRQHPPRHMTQPLLAVSCPGPSA